MIIDEQKNHKDLTMNLAPIVVFCYKRVDVLKQTILSLQSNSLAAESDLIVFSDGPKNNPDAERVQEVREYLEKINGFKSVTINAKKTNMGLANSVIAGVSEVIKTYGKVIVVEDDLLTSPNFLSYMNEALNFYGDDEKIFSISGYSPVFPLPKSYPFDTFFTMRACSWGWATWQKTWESVNWDLNDFEEFSAKRSRIREFNKIGSDLYGLLKKQYEGKIDSWAIRWCYDQFKKNQFCVYPKVSKVENIGYGEGATHTSKKLNRFATVLDNTGQEEFHFVTSEQGLDHNITKSFSKHSGIFNRLISKISSIISR